MTRDEAQALMYERRGIKVGDCTADEWLQLACDQEQIVRAMSPFDTAYPHMVQLKESYFNLAQLSDRLTHPH